MIESTSSCCRRKGEMHLGVSLLQYQHVGGRLGHLLGSYVTYALHIARISLAESVECGYKENDGKCGAVNCIEFVTSRGLQENSEFFSEYACVTD